MSLDLNKTELRELVRDLVQKEIKSTSFTKDMKNNVSTVLKDESFINEKEIRDLVRQMLVNMHKLMWQRQDSWKRNI